MWRCRLVHLEFIILHMLAESHWQTLHHCNYYYRSHIIAAVAIFEYNYRRFNLFHAGSFKVI